MMSLWDALRMNMMISYQELVRTFLSSGDLEASGKRYPIDVKMIAPFSDEVMKVNGLNGKANSAKVHFYAINDFGGAIEGNARL